MVYPFVILCAIWYHLYNLKQREKHPWRSDTFSKVQAEACNVTKSNNPAWVFFTFLKLNKWYQTDKGMYYKIKFLANFVTRLSSTPHPTNTYNRGNIGSRISQSLISKFYQVKWS